MNQTPAHTIHNPELLKLMPRDAKCIVEVGCMLGALAREYKKLNPNCQYIGIDIDADYAEQAKEHCDYAFAINVEQIDSNLWSVLAAADCWVFGDTLEHLYDPWIVLKRIRGSMKLGDSLIACVPNAQNWFVQAQLSTGQFRYQDSGLLDRTHVRWFTRVTLAELFVDCGFSIQESIHRFLVPPPPESILQAIGKLAEVSGADADQAMQDAKIFQFVHRVVAV